MQRKHKGNQRRPIMNAFKNKNIFTIHSRKKINKKSIKKTLLLLEMKNIQKKKKIGIKR